MFFKRPIEEEAEADRKIGLRNGNKFSGNDLTFSCNSLRLFMKVFETNCISLLS